MGFLETIGIINQVITIAKPIIESVSSKIQPEMKQFAEKLLVYSENNPEVKDFVVVMDKSADILGDILFVLGIKTEAADVIGFKISQSEKSVFDFEIVEDYLNYLNNDVELGKDKFNCISEVEKIVYSILGMAVETVVIGEKIGIILNPDMLIVVTKVIGVGKVAIDAPDIIDIMKMIKENGEISISEIYSYFIGDGGSDRAGTGRTLHNIIELLHPNKSDDIIAEFKEKARE